MNIQSIEAIGCKVVSQGKLNRVFTPDDRKVGSFLMSKGTVYDIQLFNRVGPLTDIDKLAAKVYMLLKTGQDALTDPLWDSMLEDAYACASPLLRKSDRIDPRESILRFLYARVRGVRHALTWENRPEGAEGDL